MSDPDFFDLRYLANGSPIQRAGFDAIDSLGIIASLREFDPVLVGTLPLGLFVAGSDLDILCFANDLGGFKQNVIGLYSSREKFQVREETLRGTNAVMSSFTFEGFDFEIFAQSTPVRKQVAYCHLCIEWRLMQERDHRFKEQLLALKSRGVKTEPAFAQLLGLEGDPYDAILALEPPRSSNR